VAGLCIHKLHMWKNSVSRNTVSNHAKTNTFQNDPAWEHIKCDTE